MTDIEVIGPGFGRTGTMSLYTALKALGYKPHHMYEVLTKGREALVGWARLGRQLMTNSKPDMKLMAEVLSGFNATTDFPSCTYYKFLLEANPKAKVVLTVRDPAAWYDSATSTIFAFTKVYESTVLLRHTPFMSMMRDASNLIPDMVFNPMFGGAHRLQDREHCMEVYRRHVEEVKRVVPKEQLLLFSVKDGWEPLCKFLGKPVPSTPFPNVNERAKFRKQILAIKIIDGALVLLTLALAIGLGYYAGKKM